MVNTRAGTVVELNTPTKVRTIGQYAFDFWTDVLTLPHTDLPSGFSSKPYAFVVMGTIGNPDWIHPHVPRFCKIEVGVGISTSPGVYAFAHMRLQIDGFTAGGSAGMPFMFVLDTAAHNIPVGDSTADLVVRARMEANETRALDPFLLAKAQPSFEILEATIHCWDRTVMAGQGSHYQDVTIDRLSTGDLRVGPDVLGITNGFGFVGEQWMIYYSVEYQPATTISPGTSGRFAFDLHWNPGGGANLCNHLGLESIGPGLGTFGTDRTKYRNVHHLGNFGIATLQGDAVWVEVEHDEQHNGTGAHWGLYAHVLALRVLAVQLDFLSYVNAYEPTDFVAFSPGFYANKTPPKRSGISCKEMANAVPTRSVVMATTTRDATTGSTVPWVYDLRIGAGTKYLRRGSLVETRFRTGTPLILAAIEEPFPPNQTVVCMETVLSPYAVWTGNHQWNSLTTSFVSFDMETSFVGGYGDETPGPDVYVVPDGEADGTTLPTFPITPSDSYSEAPRIDLVGYRNPLGYRITWPRDLVPRDERVWSWAALKESEVEALEDFVYQQGVAAIRYTRPDDNDNTSRVYALIGRPTFSPLRGGLFKGSMRGIELVYGTGITPRVLT